MDKQESGQSRGWNPGQRFCAGRPTEASASVNRIGLNGQTEVCPQYPPPVGV